VTFKTICRPLFLISILSLAPVFGDTNVLVNPDFEKGIDGWANRSCQIEAVNSPVHSGKASAKVFGRGETWQGIRQTMLGKMVLAKTYKVSGWVRLDNAPSATIMVSFEQRDDSGTKYPNVASVKATDSNWVQISGNFTLDVNGTLAGLDVYLEGPPAGVNFYVDDVNIFGPESQEKKEVVKPAEPNAAIKIDVNTRHQKLEGFGAAGGYYTMEFTINKKKQELYNVLFKDLGLDIFRIRNNYDMEPNSFRETVEIVKGAKAVNGNLKIMMSSWSPPAKLKSEGKTVGGTLAKKDGKYVYDDFAQWWADSLAAYAKEGVKIDFISIQNEPDFLSGWDCCLFAPKETADKAGYNTAFEAVWNKLNTQMGANMPKMLAPEAYGITISRKYIENLNDLSHVYGYAHHLYDCPGNTSGCGTEPDKYLTEMKNFKEKYGDKPFFQTEYQHKEPDSWQQAMNTAILMHNSLAVEDVAGYLYWDLFWGPGTVSLISIDNPDSFTINPVYYAFKQYSAFTDPLWQRVDALCENTGLRITAYISPDNKKLTAVIINTTADMEIAGDLSFKDFSIAKGQITRSSKNEKCVLIGDYKANEPLKLPANSITTLTITGK